MRQLLATLQHRPAPLVGTFVALVAAAMVVTWAFALGNASGASKLPAQRLDIPRFEMSSGFGKFLVEAVSPGDGLVVEGVVFEAAVEDADEAVPEDAEGGVVGVAGGPVAVVEGPGAGGGGEGSEGPQVDGVRKAVVAGVAGQHDPFGAGRPGDRLRAGIVFARLGGAIPVRLVAELA
jgi:hypothetical protein